MIARRETTTLRNVGVAIGSVGVAILVVSAVIGILGSAQQQHQPERSETGEVVAVAAHWAGEKENPLKPWDDLDRRRS